MANDLIESDYGRNIAAGLLPNQRLVSALGWASIGTAVSTIYSGNVHAPILARPPITGIIPSVASDSVEDTNTTGLGAWQVLVEGLDTSFNEISEIVTLAGQTPVVCSKTYVRLLRLSVIKSATIEGQVGNIHLGSGTFTLGVPAITYQDCRANSVKYNRSMTAAWTIPAGHDAYINSLVVSCFAPAGRFNFWVVLRDATNANAPWYVFGGLTLGGSTFERNFVVPPKINEKMDIEIRAKSTTSDEYITGALFMTMVKRGYI